VLPDGMTWCVSYIFAPFVVSALERSPADLTHVYTTSMGPYERRDSKFVPAKLSAN